MKHVIVFIALLSVLKIDAQVIPYRLNNLWGICDVQGRVICAPKYDSVYFFNFPQRTMVVKNKRLGMVTREGKEIIPPQYDRVDDQFHHILLTKEGKTGICDTSGTMLLARIYNEVTSDMAPYGERYFYITLGSKKGIARKKGNKIVVLKEPAYDKIEYAWYAGVFECELKGKPCYLDTFMKPLSSYTPDRAVPEREEEREEQWVQIVNEEAQQRKNEMDVYVNR